MKIGIIVAMEKELNLLLHLLENKTEITVGDTTLHLGVIGANDIAITRCGIGKVNAAVGAMTLIDSIHPSLVINTGVAGGVGADAGVLDVVVADAVAYHDFWCLGEEWGRVPGCPRLFRTASLHVDFQDPTVKTGLIASGDLFVSRPEEVEHIRSLYPDVQAVDMESAAIAQVCYLKNVPFYCLRVISDTPGGDDNISQYEYFWEDAPRHSFNVLHRILLSI
ncbi:MAG: 5'-methylthioadenosine/adenosylhomocysteine nucleosidase [Duncaniella sp.]|nr:5'-methylthioadenosine/adenosylhomocysteine nucleosidase [Duncaniella sp.]